MILHAIELTHVGRFRETVRLGPFSAGVNIVSAPNESGKSTALRGAARALFDRHNTKGEELKSLQPAGTDLAPRIAVEFETRAGKFRVEKTFLTGPRSTLHAWQSGAWALIAEADAADQRMQSLLQSDLPGRGATRPEHWGFLGFLWARQGELTEWPGLKDAAVGQRIRARLARVELDPVIEKLRTLLGEASDAILTSKGGAKANGSLDVAERELEAIETELAALQRTRASIDAEHQRYQQAHASVAQLEKEHAELERASTALREQATAAERLRGELELRRQALATAQEKLNALAADADMLALRRGEVEKTRDALAKAELTTKTQEARLAEVRAQLDKTQAERPQHESRLNALRAEHQRLQELLKLRRFVTAATMLAKKVLRAEAVAAEIAVLETRRTQLPAIAPAKLVKLEAAAEAVRTLQAQLQALGLTVELTPERDGSVIVNGGANSASSASPATGVSHSLSAAKPARFQAPQTLDLSLAGWGRVIIRSGAQDAQNAAAKLTVAENALRDALQESAVVSVDAAREAIAARRELDAQHKAVVATLAPQLGDHATLDALREAAAVAKRRADSLTTTLQPTSDELALSNAELETAETRLAEALPANEKALKALDARLDQLRVDERSANQVAHDSARALNEHSARLVTLETQISDLSQRFPEGLDAAKSAAQVAFVQAEARVTVTKSELPADFEQLPGRSKRAVAGMQQIANELQARRTERDLAEGTLKTLGGQGLYSRETELLEKKEDALLRRDDARSRGWSARIAHDLIEHRKQAATKAVLTPLEQRLTVAFAQLSGDTSREVFLDEHLQITGLGRVREETHAFENLSQGAKEQLLLCLRIAVAQELAVDEPQVLILDDVLVNTDKVRQDRVLDVLSGLASKLQIVILTCHPDRYRGVGLSIAITPLAK